jgi:hypothetical protein
METRTKVGMGIVGALVLAFGLRSCFVPSNRPITLKPNEPTLITNGVGHGVIVTSHPNGSVTVKPKTLGWSFDPGIMAGSNGLNIGMEVGYWYRLNLLVGVQWYPLKPNALIALGYRLPYKRLSNLSVYAGVTTSREPTIGMFLRFGSS